MPRTRTRVGKKKRTRKKACLATSVMLSVLAVIVAAVAYKQIFLASYVSSQFPDSLLAKSIESFVQEHFTPSLFTGLAKTKTASDVQQLLSGFLGGVVPVTVQQNYITEVKVLELEDFLGQNAQMRVVGAVDLTLRLPTMGDLESHKDYMTTVFKRDASYYFKTLSLKDDDATEWTEWPCAQTLASS